MNNHSKILWQGQWIEEQDFKIKLDQLSIIAAETLQKPLSLKVLLQACQKLSDLLKTQEYQGLESADRSDLAYFLNEKYLNHKIDKELGVAALEQRQGFSRVDFKNSQFEQWAPLGFLAHIAPSNAPLIGFMSMIEGLILGNFCFLKTSRSDQGLSLSLLESLIQCDSTNTLKDFIIAAPLSSSNKAILSQVIQHSDGVAIWGSDSAVQGVKELTPRSTKIIEWGHKVSLAYVAKECLYDDKSLEALARECCLLEQQACSSPQCIYIEVDNEFELYEWADKFAPEIGRASCRERV